MNQYQKKYKALVVVGTRPEAIKMAPVIKKMQNLPTLKLKVCITAQHREMLDSVLYSFNIKPDYDLDLMSHNQSITDITIRVLSSLETIIKKDKPNIVLVHGDTTTTLSTALSAFYQKVPVAHVEAGLRSGNIYSPYPEEMNRKLVSMIAKLHFAPTEGNKKNLLLNGVKHQDIFITGNTVIDALKMTVKDRYIFSEPLLNDLKHTQNKLILLTAHRRENFGEPMKNIFNAVKKILEEDSNVELVFPVHLNPEVKKIAHNTFRDSKNAHLIAPLDYTDFANLMARSYIIMTDSGGIQEEAPSLGKPVLVLRTETERPEAVSAGTVKVVGVNSELIYKSTKRLLYNMEEYENMAKAINPYGDGYASGRICETLIKWLEAGKS